MRGRDGFPVVDLVWLLKLEGGVGAVWSCYYCCLALLVVVWLLFLVGLLHLPPKCSIRACVCLSACVVSLPQLNARSCSFASCCYYPRFPRSLVSHWADTIGTLHTHILPPSGGGRYVHTPQEVQALAFLHTHSISSSHLPPNKNYLPPPPLTFPPPASIQVLERKKKKSPSQTESQPRHLCTRLFPLSSSLPYICRCRPCIVANST